MASESDLSETAGVRNPYALAELELGRRVDWSSEDTKRVFERAFGQPYETLFDPQYDSPLYDVTSDDDDGSTADGSTRAVEWRDTGTFLDGFPEFSDPIQGDVEDCYLLAALGAIAWANPRHLVNRVQWIEDDTPDYVRFTFTGDAGRGEDVLVEVTQRLPVKPGSELLYARSRDPYEIWPGVYEKAYAKWKTGTDGDEPPIDQIGHGSAPITLGELSGVEPTVWFTADNSVDDLWEILWKACESRGNATADPMVAGTYDSATEAPDDVSYGGANVVASHSYTVLGYQVRDDTRYVFLRNPWDETEAEDDLDGWWNVESGRSLSGIDLSNTNGVFGLPVEEFERYFEVMALASP